MEPAITLTPIDIFTLASTNAAHVDELNSAAVKTRIKFPDVRVFVFNDPAIG